MRRSITDAEGEDMYDVLSIGVASILWNYVVETSNVPLGVPPSQCVEVVVTLGICPIPEGLKSLPIK